MNTLRITRPIASQHRANEASRNVIERCKVFHMVKRINRMPKKRMTNEVMQKIFSI